jgi:hypothetical protein
MGLMDGLFLTLINAVVCLALPKLLSVFLADKGQSRKSTQASPTAINSQQTISEVPSFP